MSVFYLTHQLYPDRLAQTPQQASTNHAGTLTDGTSKSFDRIFHFPPFPLFYPFPAAPTFIPCSFPALSFPIYRQNYSLCTTSHCRPRQLRLPNLQAFINVYLFLLLVPPIIFTRMFAWKRLLLRRRGDLDIYKLSCRTCRSISYVLDVLDLLWVRCSSAACQSLLSASCPSSYLEHTCPLRTDLHMACIYTYATPDQTGREGLSVPFLHISP